MHSSTIVTNGLGVFIMQPGHEGFDCRSTKLGQREVGLLRVGFPRNERSVKKCAEICACATLIEGGAQESTFFMYHGDDLCKSYVDEQVCPTCLDLNSIDAILLRYPPPLSLFGLARQMPRTPTVAKAAWASSFARPLESERPRRRCGSSKWRRGENSKLIDKRGDVVRPREDQQTEGVEESRSETQVHKH